MKHWQKLFITLVAMLVGVAGGLRRA